MSYDVWVYVLPHLTRGEVLYAPVRTVQNRIGGGGGYSIHTGSLCAEGGTIACLFLRPGNVTPWCGLFGGPCGLQYGHFGPIGLPPGIFMDSNGDPNYCRASVGHFMLAVPHFISCTLFLRNRDKI